MHKPFQENLRKLVQKIMTWPVSRFFELSFLGVSTVVFLIHAKQCVNSNSKLTIKTGVWRHQSNINVVTVQIQ